MTNRGEHISLLRSDVDAWNQWRSNNPTLRPNLVGISLVNTDLRRANLSRLNLAETNLNGADLRDANLQNVGLLHTSLNKAKLAGTSLYGANLNEACLDGADLRDAILHWASLRWTKLCKADLRGADFRNTDLRWADLRLANLSKANLRGANLSNAKLEGADLTDADLRGAILVETKCDHTNFTGCKIYGISAWDVNLAHAKQSDLIITRNGEPRLTVDNIEVAQFIYLLLNNKKIRYVIDSITSKVVLILGRFTEERKTVLDALRNELRNRDYSPILFDFEKPASRDLTETIVTLAGMARFIIADITEAKSIPQELSHIIPNLPSVPIQPVLLESDREYAMFQHWGRYPWVLPDFLYKDEAHLLASLANKVIEPAEQKRQNQTNAV